MAYSGVRIIIIWLACAAIALASPIYTAANLGGTVGYSVSSTGEVAGWAQTPSGAQQAFVSNGGSATALSFPFATETFAYGVNAAGTVVGTSYINGQAHGAVWTSSSATDLGAGVYATGINDSGEVIGSNGHAFVLENGQYQDLGAIPGANWSAAYGINDSGTVVGDGMTPAGTFRAIIWSAQGGMTVLGTLGGASSQANAVNNRGEVAGFASLASGYQHAFSYSNGTMTDLGTLGGGSSYAYGINASGQIVGYSYLAGGDTHAFLYLNGQMLDLNSLLVPGSGWELLAAYGINDQGQITGEGLYNGVLSAFLLTDPPAGGTADLAPVPEPGVIPLLGLGALVLLWRRRS